MKLSIIIVHYNVSDLLRNCVKSLQKYILNLEFEIIVIDNCSPDESWKSLIEEFSDVKFIASTENKGFSCANNTAVKTAKGEYILLLNPDTEFEGFYMKEILQFADSIEQFGCLGVRMHDKKGNFLPESKRAVPDMVNSFEKLFTNYKNNTKKSYYRTDIGEFDNAEVEVITGAFFLVKKKVYEKVGGLDEAYFMYGEDIDLCYTLLREGFKNFYYGKSSILHYKGESSVKDKIYFDRFYGAMQIFLNKYYRKQNPLKFKLLSAGLKTKHILELSKLKKRPQ